MMSTDDPNCTIISTPGRFTVCIRIQGLSYVMQNSSNTDIDHLKSDRTMLDTSNICISLLSIAIAIMNDISSSFMFRTQ